MKCLKILDKNSNKRMRDVIGIVLVILSVLLGWLWFGWQLSLVIFVAIVGNNLVEAKEK